MGWSDGWGTNDSSGWGGLDGGGTSFGGGGFTDSTDTSSSMDDTTDKWGSWGSLNNSIGYDPSKSGWNDYSSPPSSWNDYGSKYDWNKDYGGFVDSSGFDWGDYNPNNVGMLSFNRPNSMFDISYGNSGYSPFSGSGYALTEETYSPGMFGGLTTPQPMGLKAPTTTDELGRTVNVAPVTAKYKSPFDVTYNDMQDRYNNNVVNTRYEQDPITTAANAMRTVGKYGSLANPALGISGIVGNVVDMANRSSYGLPNDYSGIAGSVASNLVGGGLGGMTLGNLTSAGVKDMQNTGSFGDEFGSGMAKGLLGMTLGQFGPLGSLANMGLGDMLKTGLGVYGAYNTNRLMKDYAGKADVTGRLGQLQQNLYANKASNPVYRNDLEQARREAIAAMSAQGKLGSGARVTAASKLAENSADRNFQNYAQSYLQNMGNQYNVESQNNLNVLRGKLAQQQMLQRSLMDMADSEGWL